MKRLITQSKRLRSLLPALVLMAGSGCKEVEDIITPKLPDATQEGKGTFGCKVDGDLWLPFVQHTLDTEVEADYPPAGGGTFALRAEQEHASKPFQYIHLIVRNPAGSLLKPGTYSTANGFEGRLEVYNALINSYVTSATGPAALTITKVEPHTEMMPSGKEFRYTIVAGTFAFEATDATTGRKFQLTEGRFDVKAY